MEYKIIFLIIAIPIIIYGWHRWYRLHKKSKRDRAKEFSEMWDFYNKSNEEEK